MEFWKYHYKNIHGKTLLKTAMKRILFLFILAFGSITSVYTQAIHGKESILNNTFAMVFETNNTINIVFRGAVGDATTDNSTLLQSLVNEAGTTGKYIVVPYDTFRVAVTVNIPDNVKIIGNGVFYTEQNISMFKIEGDHVSIEPGILFLGSSGGTQQIAIYGRENYWMSIKGCHFKNLGGAGFFGNSSATPLFYRGTISDCTFENCVYGIYTGKKYEYIKLENNEINGSSEYGYRLNAGNFVVNGGSVTGCTEGAIWVERGTNGAHGIISNVLLNHNPTNGSGNALYIDSITHGMMINNCQFNEGDIHLEKSKGVCIQNSQINGVTIYHEGDSTTQIINNMMNWDVTIHRDYNGKTDFAVYWGNTKFASNGSELGLLLANPYVIQSNTLNDTAFVVLNKSLDTLMYVTDSGNVHASGIIVQEMHYAQLYAIGDSIYNIGATDTYYTIIDWNTDSAINSTTTDSSITVSRSGLAMIYQGLSYTHSTNNTVMHHCVFINDIEIEEGGESQRKISVGGDVGNSGTGIVKWLNTGDIVKIKVKSDKTGNLTFNHGSFYVVFL